MVKPLKPIGVCIFLVRQEFASHFLARRAPNLGELSLSVLLQRLFVCKIAVNCLQKLARRLRV
jgi:hypothetical protein